MGFLVRAGNLRSDLGLGPPSNRYAKRYVRHQIYWPMRDGFVGLDRFPDSREPHRVGFHRFCEREGSQDQHETGFRSLFVASKYQLSLEYGPVPPHWLSLATSDAQRPLGLEA